MSGDRRIRIEPGAMLGSHRLISPLRAGGMGEVWRARDTTLSRDVAIKLLPTAWTHDADRLSRFENEARAVAQLNHPNVLTVFGVGREDGVPYLVTEVLDGRTLRNVLDDGLTDDGRVKILDFGIARLMQPLAESEGRLETATGVVVGTLGYMSPEQLAGQAADHRADIFALGVVLSEMLTGEPPAIDRVVRRCLEKDPRQRFQSAHDLAFHLESARDGVTNQPVATSAVAPTRGATILRWTPWILAAVGLIAAAWAASTVARGRISPAGHPPVRRFSVALTESLMAGEQPPLAISPDSSQIAYVLNSDGVPAIWVRSLNELTGHPIPGTEFGFAPFFSPDGQSLGFFTRDQLMRVPVAGGPPVRLGAVPPVTRGGVWASDGWIYLSLTPSDGIARIRAEGGPMEMVTQNEAML
jgi:hypothetical protein